ncbi:MAG: hypothetical protein JSV19_00360 [Phycisphaerales bacterium]|nr:MAG: hypothetical protein JSV19_00360 [Phycisphaerales bacterium]
MIFSAAAAVLAAVNAGCAVGQRPGNGLTLFLREPTTQAGYWLYLPEDYVKTGGQFVTHRRWPLVVAFHGMKPFDNDNRQIRQWGQEADRYGFIVCAPQLKTPDLMYEFPFKRITPGLKRDEDCTIAILDHLMAVTDVDPDAVLSTSWSSGGYLAHYMANRHPDRFTCVGVFQSNFSADILDPSQVPKYRDHKIAVFFTENDFKVCREESKQAAQWYARHGFDLTFAKFSALGHERTPSVAASFFARTCGAKAKTPPLELARLQVKEVPIDVGEGGTLAMGSHSDGAGQRVPPVPGGAADGRSGPPRVTSTLPSSGDPGQRPLDRSPGARAVPASPDRTSRGARTRSGSRQSGQPTSGDSKPLRTTPVPPPPSQQRTPPRKVIPTQQVEASPVRLRLSSTIGIAPLLISYSAVVPGSMRRGAYFLWTDNGEPIANGVNGQTYLTRPGEHRIKVVMTTADGKEYEADQTVTVLEPIIRRKAGE